MEDIHIDSKGDGTFVTTQEKTTTKTLNDCENSISFDNFNQDKVIDYIVKANNKLLEDYIKKIKKGEININNIDNISNTITISIEHKK